MDVGGVDRQNLLKKVFALLGQILCTACKLPAIAATPLETQAHTIFFKLTELWIQLTSIYYVLRVIQFDNGITHACIICSHGAIMQRLCSSLP